MNRTSMRSFLSEVKEYDIVIIGGGATGLGAALDAASRGYTTLLLEQYDFGKGTSSRSTKLVHGGVRYLAQGNIKLVREALRERGWLLKNAPHLTAIQPFVIPAFSWFDKYFYTIGLSIYDLLSGKLSLGSTQLLNKSQTKQMIPAINTEKLKGGILYFDGQFDDSRLCIDLATTAAKNGAILLNHCKVTRLIKTEKGIIKGVEFIDTELGEPHTVNAKAVINATGVFTDAILQLDEENAPLLVTPSQGIHLVIDKTFFSGTHAMMIPKTDDGRVLFAVPWQNKVVVGTTDTPINTIQIEPRALEEEIDFVLTHFNRYTSSSISRKDVKSVYAGLRPLVRSKNSASTALLSRDHTLMISESQLVTITGGKWTTYRKMAEDAVDNAIFVSKQANKKKCITKQLAIGNPAEKKRLIDLLIQQDATLAKQLHKRYPYTKAEVIYAARYEMVVDVEDFLARRVRLLFLDAEAAIEVSTIVAELLAIELNKDDSWVEKQINSFNSLAQEYLLV
jgi:glycerol-3-phosphate dehydrogenase